MRTPFVLLVVLTAATAGTTLYGLNTSTPAYSVFNPRWDGASALQDEADAVGAEPRILLEPADYDALPAEDTVAVVLSPDEAYTAAEAARLRAFVRRGGTLLVAEDFGPHANPLLAELGVETRFDGRLLRDKRTNMVNQSLPVASNITAHPYTAGVDRLTFNHGTVLALNGTDPLVTSADSGYLDANRNGRLDAGEPFGARPLATVEPLGDGEVILVGDPSLLINAMLDRSDNRAFVRAVFGRHDRVVLDYSHATPPPPLAYLLNTLRETPWAQAAVGVAALAGAIVATRRSTGGSAEERDAPDRAAVAAHLRREHPDWAPDRIERMVEAVERRRADGSFREHR